MRKAITSSYRWLRDVVRDMDLGDWLAAAILVGAAGASWFR